MAKRKAVLKSKVVLPPEYVTTVVEVPKKKFSWKMIVVILVLVLVGLVAAKKGWIVAATVNGRPIYSWELNTALRNRFGQQTLEGMIGEQLIADQASSQGVKVTQEDVEKKQKDVLASLGADVKLDDLLKFQGLTKEDFVKQLKLQLLVERLLTKDLTIRDTDIQNYIASNSATLSATDPAKLKSEAEQAIRTNMVNEKLQSWFAEIRKTAKVIKFP